MSNGANDPYIVQVQKWQPRLQLYALNLGTVVCKFKYTVVDKNM